MRKRNSSPTAADLVGYQSLLTYGVYRDDIKKLMKRKINSNIDLEFLVCDVFILGTIAGVRKERARRRRERSKIK